MSLWSNYPTISTLGSLRLVKHPAGPAVVDDVEDRLTTVAALIERVAQVEGNRAAALVAEWIAVETWKQVPK